MDLKERIKKLQSYKIGDYSAFNLIVPLLVAYLISLIISTPTRRQLFFLAFPVSIVVYKLCGIDSQLTDRFFTTKDYLIIKISMVYLVYRAFQ